MSIAIPATIDDVTAEWLAAATGLAIDSIRIEQIGVGVGVSSAVYRAHLTGTDVPATVVVKLPALDPAAVFTSTMLRMYLREVRFFNELAAHAPIRVPAGLHAAADEATSQFVAVMEDLGSLRLVDQNVGMTPADADAAVDALAAWHATWWGQADRFAESGTTVSLGDPIYPAVLPFVFGEGWEKVSAAMDIPASIQAIGPRFSDAVPTMLSSLVAGPRTLIHGDYRADNILFDADGSVVLLDFQLIGTGSASYDLAYFITQSLSPADASANEQRLFARWVDALRAHGVPDADLEGLWNDYRTAALFCLVYPVVASRGMDLDDPRQRALVDNMMQRFDRAASELDLAELL